MAAHSRQQHLWTLQQAGDNSESGDVVHTHGGVDPCSRRHRTGILDTLQSNTASGHQASSSAALQGPQDTIHPKDFRHPPDLEPCRKPASALRSRQITHCSSSDSRAPPGTAPLGGAAAGGMSKLRCEWPAGVGCWGWGADAAGCWGWGADAAGCEAPCSVAVAGGAAALARSGLPCRVLAEQVRRANHLHEWGSTKAPAL